MIDIDAAARLLDFDVRLGDPSRARDQLEGAVALHNMLETHRIAYLADEVGMGKTYVALGALALFRHFHPRFRVLILAPRENIQRKWMTELEKFVANNVLIADLRVKAIDGRPARPLVKCNNLLGLVHETMIDPERDFFARLSSFSLGLGAEQEDWRHVRDALRQRVPWLRPEILDARSKKEFKDNFARIVCCALPVFDLVILDEAHNLKHGFTLHSAARNRVLGLAMGRDGEAPDRRSFPGYGPRARRVLLLSATPIEERYEQLWNQLDVFGLAGKFGGLRGEEASHEDKREVTRQFLIRRVTTIRVNGEEHTKNQYRREWRCGGVLAHDDPIRVDDDRQRLVVALVQKKVAEILGNERFNLSFQIGMLASFESFLETARLKRDDPDAANFDDAEQTMDLIEREGIDVRDLNRLARAYRKRFGSEMPHPKMDALVTGLADAWERGRKALVFVRRVASVKELKARLDHRYDEWLLTSLRERLPAEVIPRLNTAIAQYLDEKRPAGSAVSEPIDPDWRNGSSEDSSALPDRGGTDTFFAWFFRGEGPRGFASGANLQQRFIQRGTAYATFFERNDVMLLLGARPGGVQGALAEALNLSIDQLRGALRRDAARFLSRAQRHPRGDRFEAAQAAAFHLLRQHEGALHTEATAVWHERYQDVMRQRHADDAPDVAEMLELPTFWTELRQRPELCDRLWPELTSGDVRARFRERELRAQLAATAARLGHAFIDLYVLAIRRMGSLDARAEDTSEGEAAEADRIRDYLDLLEGQMRTPRSERPWGAFDELADIARHFDLLVDVNLPETRSPTTPLSEVARTCGALLRQQQPVGGMSGEVNQTLVRQFRMPGYPLVLITTDLLQEGEDLHTFCSAVYHYGISWTPSAMEQRIGRIDRVRSLTDRHLSNLERPLGGDDKLQVYYPYLEDTAELLQVHRVLRRMYEFLRHMHEGLALPAGDDNRRIDVATGMARGIPPLPEITHRLQTAFPVPRNMLSGNRIELARDRHFAAQVEERFARLRCLTIVDVEIEWEDDAPRGSLLGTVRLRHRQQPFAVFVQSHGQHLVVRCVSPVGRVSPGPSERAIVESTMLYPVRVGAILGKDERTYDLTVEGDVILGAPEHDGARVSALLRRVVEHADRLEQHHLPGRDEPMPTFRDELEDDSPHGR